jgi:uncharacterized protein YqeY
VIRPAKTKVPELLRDTFNDALKQATLKQDKRRMGTLRLIIAALRDRDIAARTAGKERVSDDEILDILGKMVKQRLESARLYEEGARLDLANEEREEIAIIQSFLPKQLSEEEMRAVCAEAVKTTGAQGLRDMGKCMATLKSQYAGQMDFSKASAVVKGLLG